MHKDSVDEYILESFIIDLEDMIFGKSAHKYFILIIGLRPKLNILYRTFGIPPGK